MKTLRGEKILFACAIMICCAAGPAEKSEKVAVQFVDSRGRPVSGVTVGARWELGDLNPLPGNKPRQAALARGPGSFQTITSDGSGRALLDADALFRNPTRASSTLYALSADARQSAVVEVSPDNIGEPLSITLAPACRVKLKVTSDDLRMSGRDFDRTILSVFVGSANITSDKIIYVINRTGEFEFVLPPGKYGVSLSGRGTGGASIEPQHITLEIPEGKTSLLLDPIDLHTGKLADLLDKPAPELAGIIAWKGGDPLTLADLHGKVVVLDFWNYACSICCEEMPRLFELQKRYASDGLVVIGVHDRTAASIDEMDRKSARWKAGPWKNQDPPYRIALDGRGKGGTFDAFGITAVPEMVLIDRDGKLLAEFGRPSDPDFLEALQKALGVSPDSVPQPARRAPR